MRRVSTIVALALCTLLFASIISAQQTSTTAATTTASVPNLIRYSGTLKDAQGAALVSTAPVGVMFAIYNQEDGGAAVWQETQNVTPEANGQYSVILGSTTAAGLPGDLFSQQEQRWLSVQVQGQEEQARVLLVSVPYALKAHEADTLGGMPASAIIQAATSAAASAALANGTSVNALSNVGTPPGARGKDGKLPPNGCTEVSGYITYWNANGALCPSSLFQTANGYIGIGTTNPSTPLDVNGVISTFRWYDINEQPFVSTGFPVPNLPNRGNVFLGWGAGYFFPAPPGGPPPNVGANNTFTGWRAGTVNTGSQNSYYGSMAGQNAQGTGNAIFGYQAGLNNNPFQDANSYFGFEAGTSNTTGFWNTFVGFEAGMSNTTAGSGTFGQENTFVGYKAGMGSKTSQGNTFVGSNSGLVSGSHNANDCCNTFVGKNAGMASQTSNNTMIGYRAGEATTGGNNTFVGTKTGVSTITGGDNTFSGSAAGQNNITGNNNTFMGVLAGFNLAGGNNNIFLGFQAGSSEININSNIEIGNTGPAPLFAGNGGNNTILLGTNGISAGQQNAVYIPPILSNPNTGLTSAVTVNLANGQLGWTTITSGTNFVMGNCPSGVNYITKWLTNTPPTVQCSSIYENTTAAPIGPQVGIGTGATFQTRPSAKLEVAYSDLVTGHNPNPSALRLINNFQSTSDFTEAGIMYNASVNGANEDVVRTYGVWDGTAVYQGRFAVALQDGTGTFGDVLNVTHHGPNIGGCCEGGYVGINTDSQLATLDVNGGNLGGDPIGNVRVYELDPFVLGQSQEVCRNTSTFILSQCMGSSRRFKEDITDMGDSSSNMFQLRPVTFFYKAQYDGASHQLQHGLIAEEVAKVYPDLVEYDKDGQPYTVKYQMLTPLLLSELQKEHTVVMAQQDELQTQLQQIKAQRQEIDGLKHELQLQNASLQVRLSKLESYVATQTQMKTASNVQPSTTATPSGDSQ